MVALRARPPNPYTAQGWNTDIPGIDAARLVELVNARHPLATDPR